MSKSFRAAVDASGISDADAVLASFSEQYRGRLVIFATRRLRGDRAAAEDVVQEAFRTVLEALRTGRIQTPDVVPAFAYETVKNFCMHRGRSVARETGALGRLAVVPSAPPDDALASVINDERRRAVQAALERLEPEDRQILEMTYMDLRTSEAIGQALGLSAGAVRVRRHRALQRLAPLLDVTNSARRE